MDEASDILTFDYTMDDELKDEGREEEENVISSVNAHIENDRLDSKQLKGKSYENNDDNGEDKTQNSKISKNQKLNVKSPVKKDSAKSKSTALNSETDDVSKCKKNSKEVKPSEYKLYISGINEETKASDLQDLFAKHVQIIDVKIIRFSKIPNQSFGLVTFESDSQLQKCTQTFNNVELKGNTLTLSQNSPLKLQGKSITSSSSKSTFKKSDDSGDKSKEKKENAKSNGKETSDEKDKSKSLLSKAGESNKSSEKDSSIKVSKDSSSSKKDSSSSKKDSKVSSKSLKELSNTEDKEKSRKKEKDSKRTEKRSISRERRHEPHYNRPMISISSPSVRHSISQSRIARMQEIKQRDELERIKQERIRFQKEKERLQYERLKLKREKLEIIKLEREKIAKEREEINRRKQMVEVQRKRAEYVASKRSYDSRDDGRSPVHQYHSSSHRRDDSSSRSGVHDSSRYDSRETRNSNFKRSKYDTSIEYENRKHDSHDRDDRKEYRRAESRERRFEDSRRDRFSDKDNGNVFVDAHRSFNAPNESRNSWSTAVATNQWTSAPDRWITSFETNHPQNALTSSIIPNHSVTVPEIYNNPNGFANIALTGLSTSYMHQNRRF